MKSLVDWLGPPYNSKLEESHQDDTHILFEIISHLSVCFVNLVNDVNKNFRAFAGLGFQDQLLDQFDSAGRPTTNVTRSGWERGFALERDSAEARKMLKKRGV